MKRRDPEYSMILFPGFKTGWFAEKCLKYKMVLKAISLIAILSSSNLAIAQNICLDEIKTALSAGTEQFEQCRESGKVYYMRYKVRTVFRDDRPVQEDDFEVWIKGAIIQVKSPSMEVYGDEKDMFTVLPEQKVIYRSPAPPFDSEKRKKHVSFLQEEALEKAEIISCAEEKAMKKIALDLQGYSGLDKVVYKMDQAGVIRYNKMEYTPGMDGYGQIAKYTEYIIEEVDTDKDARLKRAVAKEFLKGGKLYGEYEGYQLVVK